jgi:phage terminase large subunit-like protein
VIAGMREDTASEESSAAGRPGSRTRHTRSTWKEARWSLGQQEATHQRRHCAGNVEHYPPARHRPADGIRMGHMETGRMFQLGLQRCDSNRRRQWSQSKSSEGNNFNVLSLLCVSLFLPGRWRRHEPSIDWIFFRYKQPMDRYISGVNQHLRTTVQTSNLGHMMLIQEAQGDWVILRLITACS